MGDIVDENVLVVANGGAEQLSLECQLAAVDYLENCRKTNRLVLDDAYRIMQKYASHCSHHGQPGVGDAFFVWARDNIGSIHKEALTDWNGCYAEFPHLDASLNSFDSDDHIWVATSLANQTPHRIVNASDSDYRDHAAALGQHGCEVQELCPGELKPAKDKKRK